MRDFVQMRQDGVRLASECIVTLQRIQATTTDKGPSLILAVEWLDEVDEKLAKARRMLRQMLATTLSASLRQIRASPRAVSARSISLMPMNGSTTPPRP